VRASWITTVSTGKAELAGFRNFQLAVVSLLFETELQTKARWKGYCRASFWKLDLTDPIHLGRAQERQLRHFPKLAGEKKFRILERL
jgi:hypothetical protein